MELYVKEKTTTSGYVIDVYRPAQDAEVLAHEACRRAVEKGLVFAWTECEGCKDSDCTSAPPKRCIARIADAALKAAGGAE